MFAVVLIYTKIVLGRTKTPQGCVQANLIIIAHLFRCPKHCLYFFWQMTTNLVIGYIYYAPGSVQCSIYCYENTSMQSMCGTMVQKNSGKSNGLCKHEKGLLLRGKVVLPYQRLGDALLTTHQVSLTCCRPVFVLTFSVIRSGIFHQYPTNFCFQRQ